MASVGVGAGVAADVQEEEKPETSSGIHLGSYSVLRKPFDTLSPGFL
jgi:hypothetical protein